MRDAKNLSWKLDLVLRGVVSPAILETYHSERSPHVRDWTVISIESGSFHARLIRKLPANAMNGSAMGGTRRCPIFRNS